MSFLLLLELGRPRRLLAAQRQRLQHTLAALGDRLRPLQLLLHAATRGELPLGHDDRLTLGVVQRVLGEPGADVVDEQLVAQRVDAAAGDLRDRRRPLGTDRGDGDDRGDDEVDRDHVDRALGHAGELLQQPAGVADDDRLGHAEAADPSGERLGERRLDDRRPHDRDRHVALHLGAAPARRAPSCTRTRRASRRWRRARGRPRRARPAPTARAAARSSRRAPVRRLRRAPCAPRCGSRASASGSRLDGLEVAAQPARRRRPPCASSGRCRTGPSLTSSSGALPRRLPAT